MSRTAKSRRCCFFMCIKLQNKGLNVKMEHKRHQGTKTQRTAAIKTWLMRPFFVPLCLGVPYVVRSATLSQISQNAGSRRRPIVGRSVVATNYGIVAASQPLAARAGTWQLERG